MNKKIKMARKELREAIQNGDGIFIIAVLTLALKQAMRK